MSEIEGSDLGVVDAHRSHKLQTQVSQISVIKAATNTVIECSIQILLNILASFYSKCN